MVGGTTFRVLVRHAEEGGHWGQVVDLPGCASQGETLDELRNHVIEAIQACLEADDEPVTVRERVDLCELAVP